MKKKKKWVKLRHKIITALALPFFSLYSKIKYGIKIDKTKIDKRQYFVVCNHQTPFDQFFISMLFKRSVYYVATEDLYQKGFLSKLLNYAVALIPIKKNTTDYKAVMTMLRVKNEGGTIAIFPEGNRTYSGKTGNIKQTIGGLMKALKLPVMALNVVGGFGKQPRFSSHVRKGKMQLKINKIIEYDDYKDLSAEECYELIKAAISVNEYDLLDGNVYPDKRSAQFIERAMYVCPTCGISKFVSSGNTVKCQKCGVEIKYDEKLRLSSNLDFPFTRVCDWYDYQEDFISNFDLSDYFDKPLYSEVGDFVRTERYKKPLVLKKAAKIELFADRYEISDGKEKQIFSFENLAAATAQGKNVLMFYEDDKTYQIRSHERFNVLIFVNVYYHFKNNFVGGIYVKPSCERGTSREFLGL